MRGAAGRAAYLVSSALRVSFEPRAGGQKCPLTSPVNVDVGARSRRLEMSPEGSDCLLRSKPL